MKCFAFDGTRQILSLALASDDHIEWDKTYDLGKKTSRILTPALQDALYEADLNRKELDLLAVSAGPGSFTGIRIGLMTAKTMSYVEEKPLGCFSNLELYYRALAFSWLSDGDLSEGKVDPAEIWSGCSQLLAPPPEQILPLILLAAGNDRAYSYAPTCPQVDLAPEGVHHLLTWAYFLESWRQTHPQVRIVLAGDLEATYRLGALAIDHKMYFPYRYEDALHGASVSTIAGAAALAALASYQDDPQAPCFQEAHPVYLAPTQAERLSRQDKKGEHVFLRVGAGLQETFALAPLYKAFPSRELAQDRPAATPPYPWRAKHNLWLPLKSLAGLYSDLYIPSQLAQDLPPRPGLDLSAKLVTVHPCHPGEGLAPLAANELEAFVLSDHTMVSLCRGLWEDPKTFQLKIILTEETQRQEGLAGSLWQKMGNFLLNYLPTEKLTLTLPRTAYPALDFFFNRSFTVDQTQSLPAGDQISLQGNL